MKKSFRKTLEQEENGEGGTALATQEKPQDAAAPAISKSGGGGALAPALPPVQGLDGEWGAGDIQIPRLSLVQKSGNLADNPEFQPGCYVFNKEIVVGDGKEPFAVTALSARKYYMEELPFDEEAMPQIFDRLEDARKAGFTLEWDTEEPRVKECADLVVLLPVPKEYATFEYGGQGYARALWTLVSSAYNSAARPIATAAMCGHLRGGLHLGGWELTSDLRKNQRNSWYVPVVRAQGLHAPEFIQFLEEEVL